MDRNTLLQHMDSYLSGTREFAALKKARAAIKKTPPVNALVTEYRKKQNMLMTQKLSQAQAEKLMNELNASFESLQCIKMVAEYFQAVDSFNNCVHTLIQDLHAGLESKLGQDAPQ